MKGSDLYETLRLRLGEPNNRQLAKKLGITATSITINSKPNKKVTPGQIANLLKKAIAHNVGAEFFAAVHPVVEFFEIEKTQTAQKKKWLPFDANTHRALRDDLAGSKGIYAFYNSEGEIIYMGRTLKLDLFEELKNAFNRDFPSYEVLAVKHAWKKYKPNTHDVRQIKRKTVRLVETARYFSCYRVVSDLIQPLEALLIRMIPNDVINVRMEKLKVVEKKLRDRKK